MMESLFSLSSSLFEGWSVMTSCYLNLTPRYCPYAYCLCGSSSSSCTKYS